MLHGFRQSQFSRGVREYPSQVVLGNGTKVARSLGSGFDKYGRVVELVVAEGVSLFGGKMTAAIQIPCCYGIGAFDNAQTMAGWADRLFVWALRKAPKTTPEARGWALLQQYSSVSVRQDQEVAGAQGKRFGWLGGGVAIHFATQSGLTVFLKGAGRAVGVTARAECRAQVHDGLGVVGTADFGRMAFRQMPQFFLRGAGAGPAFNGVVACQHPFDITVEDDGWFAKGNCQYGSGGGTADTGQTPQQLQIVGELPAMVVGDDLRGSVEVPSASIIAKAGPAV